MKLAVFDIDGTLTLGDGLGTRCFFDAFDAVFGVRIADRRLDAYVESTDGGIALEAARRVLGRAPEDGELERFKSAYLDLLGREITRVGRPYRPVPGAEHVLPLVASRADWCVAIATGNWRRAAALKLECARVAAPQAAAFSEDGASRSAIVAAAIGAAGMLAGAAFEQVVYVGDQPWDLRAARELGIAFLGIGRDARARNLEREGATVVAGYGEPDSFLKLLDTVVELPD